MPDALDDAISSGRPFALLARDGETVVPPARDMVGDPIPFGLDIRQQPAEDITRFGAGPCLAPSHPAAVLAR